MHEKTKALDDDYMHLLDFHDEMRCDVLLSLSQEDTAYFLAAIFAQQ